jgi:hypothetical protein
MRLEEALSLGFDRLGPLRFIPLPPEKPPSEAVSLPQQVGVNIP